VIRLVATSIVRPPATTCCAVALASFDVTSSTSNSIGNPCASICASVQPSGDAASTLSARRRWRSGVGIFGIGML
jgi:hypothetical protein